MPIEIVIGLVGDTEESLLEKTAEYNERKRIMNPNAVDITPEQYVEDVLVRGPLSNQTKIRRDKVAAQLKTRFERLSPAQQVAVLANIDQMLPPE